MVEEKKVIFPEDSETASCEIKTVWVSRNGHVFFDERAARWEGATHLHCKECGKPALKPYILCPSCADNKDKERYEKREKKEWDGKSWLYSESVEEFFEDMDEAEEYLFNEAEDDNKMTLEDLRLRICKPVYARFLDEDYFYDALPEDSGVPEELLNAVDTFNKAIKEYGIISWEPGEYALKLSEEWRK